MADINVSLGLDDSKYKQGLANAQASAQRLGNQLSNSFGGGVGAISRLGQGVDALNVRFQNLGRVIVGVGLATFVSSALRSAEALGDMSGALGVTTNRLMEMEAAAGIAGGNLETVTGMLARMEGNLQGAVEGNKEMRDALDKVGIGLTDIENKTPDQLFNSIAIALGKMTNPLERAAVGAQLFGKAARTFDFSAYVGGITRVYGTLDRQAKAMEEADKMMEGFRHTMALVGAEFLKLVSPVTALIAPFTRTNDAMGKAAVVAKVLAAALGFFAASAIIRGITTIVGGMRALAAMTGLSAAATALNTKTTTANTNAALLNANAQVFMAGAHARVGAATAAVAVAEIRLTQTRAAGTATAAELATLENILAAARARLATATQAAAITQAELTAATAAGTVANTANAASGAGILAWLGKYKIAALAAAAAAALLYSSDLNKGEDEQMDKIRKSGELLKRRKDALAGLSEAEKRRYNALSQQEKNAIIDTIVAQQEQKKLNDIMNNITGGPSKKGGFALSAEDQKKIDESYKKQQDAIKNLQTGFQDKNQEQLKGLEYSMRAVTMTERQKAITSESNELQKRFNDEIANLEERRISLQGDLNSKEAATRESAKRELPLVEEAIRKVTSAYQEQIPQIEAAAAKAYDAAQTQISGERLKQFAINDTARQQDELLRIQDEMAKSILPTVEQRYYDIGAAARDSANQAIRAENERRRLAGLSALSAAEEAKYREAANANTGKLIDATRRSFEQSRSFSAGWKRAFNEYAENAGNAARRAENLFKTVTAGMEEAIVDFAKTGKFEFKGFLNMMLEELLRTQIQQVFAQMMGNMSNTMRGMSFMPGESGGMPSGNILGSLGGIVGSIGSSIGKLFGGFFADGGTLGAGKFGIVGERGPELISGPATITPLGMGGSTYVTYNINAVDAMSFKQLVAQDPGFMHAVVMQGAKSAPMTRR
jgi:lambda family phage tail tape measure protein